MLCDTPSNYMREPESTGFIADVPTVWDESIVLDGKMGEYIVTARRSGNVWYVGGITDWTARDIEVEDTGVLNVRWRNGALGSMAVTMLTYPKNLEGSITIIGEKGTARVGGVAVNEIQIWDFAEPKDYDASVREASYATTSVYGFGHPLYYKNVIDVLRGEAEPETDGREGLKSLEVLIAAYRSARDHKTISLPLEY